MTERVIRKEANRLKDQGLVEFSLEGMAITEEGQVALEMLKMFFHDLRGLKDLESDLAQKLQIKKVIIGATGVMGEELTLKELGRSAADYLKSILEVDSVIGITGGTSVYSIIEGYRKEKVSFQEAIVVPARGGLGKKTEYQANTLAEKLADKLGSQYRMLYTPDNLSREAIESLKKEPEIDEIMKVLNRINVLAFGIGKAQKMAERRSLDDAEIGKIIDKGAVSEAFGYYFNKSGEKVHEISTIGIDLDKFKAIEHLIAVASGTEKVEAIVSICKLNKNLVLVTDENVAKIILNKES
jgi:central glycolytic genes regulator